MRMTDLFDPRLCMTFLRSPRLSMTTLCYPIGRVENRKCWKTTKPQVDPIDADKNKTISMI